MIVGRQKCQKLDKGLDCYTMKSGGKWSIPCYRWSGLDMKTLSSLRKEESLKLAEKQLSEQLASAQTESVC